VAPVCSNFGARMKTTIDIADSLILQAKRAAAADGTTLREVVEAGLRAVLEQRQARSVPFKLGRAYFKGKGLQPAMAGARWEDIRDRACEGRGGR